MKQSLSAEVFLGASGSNKIVEAVTIARTDQDYLIFQPALIEGEEKPMGINEIYHLVCDAKNQIEIQRFLESLKVFMETVMEGIEAEREIEKLEANLKEADEATKNDRMD